LYTLLERIKSPNLTLSRICVRDISKPRSVNANFTDSADDIFNDANINFIVELIDDAEASFQIVKRALLSGRPVVTGNDRMLARHIVELIELQKQTGVAVLYDASACGSIPVIRNLEEYYDNDLLISVKGILNGASNYVLSKVFNEKMTYADALRQATELGYVEADSSLDLDGYDSLYKLIIITIHAFGNYVAPEEIFCYGITSMNDCDIRFANEKDRRVKLVAHVEKIEGNRLVMCVMPQLLSRNKYIYGVEDEYNGVVIKGLYYDKQFMFGRGAGGYPTGAAVLSDITACLYNYRYEYKKRNDSEMPTFTNNKIFRIYYRYTSPEDRALIHFEDVFESYTSVDYNYIVGNVSLHTLLKARQRLAQRNVFVAAYPRD
jgi:homoserine dehydrogenase